MCAEQRIVGYCVVLMLLLVASAAVAETPPAPRVAEAVTLAGAEALPEGERLAPVYRVQLSKGTFVFADIRDADGELAGTAIQVQRPDQEDVMIPIPRELLRQGEWVRAATGPAEDEAWGVMESWTSGGGGFVLARTTDGGGTWSLVRFRKPRAEESEWVDLRMSAEGNGSAVVHFKGRRGEGVRQGYWIWTTADGGETWRADRTEADDLEKAEFIYEFEGPDLMPEEGRGGLPRDGRL